MSVHLLATCTHRSFHVTDKASAALRLVAALHWPLGLAAPVLAQAPPPAAVPQDARVSFDLPAQPLAAALDAYARMAGRPVLFRDILVAGRMSARVDGMHTGREALDLMLAGTGLVADDVGSGMVDAFVLKPAPGEGERASPQAIDRYGGMAQARIMDALCGDSLTRPGGYRALLRISVASDGRAEVRLLGTTGKGERDAAVLRAIAHTRFAPPNGVPQPLTLIVLPRTDIAGWDCPARGH